ncbi:MAG: mismatch-specific DNA-glycosylase [Myxococcota bacterium]
MSSVLHLPGRTLASELAHLQLSLPVGACAILELRRAPGPVRLRELLASAGFEAIELRGRTRGGGARVRARRARTLPDWIRRGLRLLVCGLNPSLYSVEHGVPFARPGNRFWPAAWRAGIVTVDRDPFAALAGGVGFTDCVKRATSTAKRLEPREYRRGLQRVARCARVYRPRVLCFVGLEGWRRAVDPRAVAGPVRWPAGRQLAYLMPSTSGLNAHADLDELSKHLHRALHLPLDFDRHHR